VMWREIQIASVGWVHPTPNIENLTIGFSPVINQQSAAMVCLSF